MKPLRPLVIPDTTLLAVQPVEQDFCFSGYTAAVPVFQQPGYRHDCRVLADPQIYGTVSYEAEIPEILAWEGQLSIHTNGTLNALTFLNKNFLAFELAEQRAVEWMMNQLVLPLTNPMPVDAVDSVSLRFSYRAGCPLEALQDSLQVERHAPSRAIQRAA